MESAVTSVTITGMLYWHFILLFSCSIFSPGTDYCYDNVFADITLEGGHPGVDSPYGIVDWYTWSGWLEAWGLHLMINFMKDLVQVFVILGASMTFMLTTSIPFCVDGDFVKLGIDFCAVLTFLKI